MLKVLKLSAQGLPQSWISLEQAVIHYAPDEVRWESGREIAVFHGGHNALTGQQSIITVNSAHRHQGCARHQSVRPASRPDQRRAVSAGPQHLRLLRVIFCSRRCSRASTSFRSRRTASTSDERRHRLPSLQPPQEPPHARAGRNAVAVRALCAHPVGNFILRNRRILADQMDPDGASSRSPRGCMAESRPAFEPDPGN